MRESFVLYTSVREIIEPLTDEQKGQLFKTILDYEINDEVNITDSMVNLAFIPIKQQLDRCNADWELKKQARSEAGKKGMQSRWAKAKEEAPKPPKETAPKEKKSTYGEHKHVRLTATEYDRLIADYGEQETADAIQFFDDYMEEKNYKTKSHNMTLRRWVFKAVAERKAKVTPINNRFNNMMQNSYTSSEMSELERQLLDN